jgi:prohibitin 2
MNGKKMTDTKLGISIPHLIGGAIIVILLFVGGCGSYYIVNPGHRGVLVTNGHVAENFRPEGLGFKLPFISDINLIDVRQQTRGMSAECYSVDLQQVTAALKVLYRVPEQSVVSIFHQYSGDPFDSLIQPRVNEAFKESTAKRSAEQIVKEREQVKAESLAALKRKVGELLIIDDLVIENLDLSKDLEAAIESKMVQEQEKEKARFTKEKAEIDAQTAFIRAQGEAKAINIRGEALRNNPSVVNLTVAEKWDGKAPTSVVVSKGGANILLPLDQ